jgi:16S rRNA (cytosine1402-N4)-methyltransferase
VGDRDDAPGRPHRRRARYRGTHPRDFAQRYKELAPDKYPGMAAHRRERGNTPAGQHVSILVDESVSALDLKPGQRGVDATLGWGGHAERFLAAIAPSGQLLGLDQDPVELPKAEARLRAAGFGEDSLLVRRTSFGGLRPALDAVGWSDGVDFVFADLGVSSMQIDDPARGFSFRADGPLDMRMNPGRGLSAAEWLTRVSGAELANALRDNADEPHAETIAETLRMRRGTLATTLGLADAVREAVRDYVPADEMDLAVRRVFQAVRIAVNDEFRALDAFLRQVPSCLRAMGRIAILTFHSGEDRRVKASFAEGARTGVYRAVSAEVTRASFAEQRANPRAKSAKLRWAQRA